MFNPKHSFLRSLLKIWVLFFIVEAIAYWLWQHSFEIEPLGDTVYNNTMTGQSKDFNDYKISMKTFYLYIPAFFIFYSFMGKKIATERTENAEKRIQKDFPYFYKGLTQADTSFDLASWIQRNNSDWSYRDYRLLCHFADHQKRTSCLEALMETAPINFRKRLYRSIKKNKKFI